MKNVPKIVVLGGASETVRAVQWLKLAGIEGVLVWEKNAKRKKTKFPVGNFDDLPKPVAILDVSHAFDEETRAEALARWPKLPYARFGKAPWLPTNEDIWTEVQNLNEAVAALPEKTRVFAATGIGSLKVLAQHDGAVFLRQLKQHNLEFPLPHGKFVFSRAPFSVAAEITLFCELEIDVLLARNVGGINSFPKLEAARKMKLPVILLRSPCLPEGPHLKSFTEIKDWISTLRQSCD
ncbi:MAG TPA: hypothetical protein DCE52_00380 [Rhodobacteraceae bacterium]|nr:precorrin-6A/cobalt-precorrin-6A reductase [Alphaproteobacteria bacterium]MCH9832629.1 precorrin-6A/cobalt-precorrin-6A reductase [Alphaproteobacteria bacterium]HAB36464.1 hypothetical protein [Paracoccaceae bacterium]